MFRGCLSAFDISMEVISYEMFRIWTLGQRSDLQGFSCLLFAELLPVHLRKLYAFIEPNIGADG